MQIQNFSFLCKLFFFFMGVSAVGLSSSKFITSRSVSFYRIEYFGPSSRQQNAKYYFSIINVKFFLSWQEIFLLYFFSFVCLFIVVFFGIPEYMVIMSYCIRFYTVVVIVSHICIVHLHLRTLCNVAISEFTL